MWIILRPHTNSNTQGQSQAVCAVPHAVWVHDLLQLLLAASLRSVTKRYLCEDLPSAFSIGPCPVPEYVPMLLRTHRQRVPVKANLSGVRIVCFDHWVDIITSVDASSLEAFGLRTRRCQGCAERTCMFPWQCCHQACFLCLLLCLADNEDCTTWVLISEILPNRIHLANRWC